MFVNLGVFSNFNISAVYKNHFSNKFSNYLVVSVKRMLGTDQRRIVEGLICCYKICCDGNCFADLSKITKWIMKLETKLYKYNDESICR